MFAMATRHDPSLVFDTPVGCADDLIRGFVAACTAAGKAEAVDAGDAGDALMIVVASMMTIPEEV